MRKLTHYFLFTKWSQRILHLYVRMCQLWSLLRNELNPSVVACTLHCFHTWSCYTCLIVGWRVWQSPHMVDPVSLAGAEWPPLFQWKLRRDLLPTLRMQTPMQKNPGNQRSCSRAADAQISTLCEIKRWTWFAFKKKRSTKAWNELFCNLVSDIEMCPNWKLIMFQ